MTSRLLWLASRPVPRALRRALHRSLLRARLDHAVNRLLALPVGQAPDRPLLERLRAGWGNLGWAADLEFLEDLTHRATVAQGPILECGSGLTTLLLAALAGRRGVAIVSLEHDPIWHRAVREGLDRYGLGGVRLLRAPLVGHDGYAWYDVREAGLPPAFRLIVCDGPPARTAGGRYGLFPRMHGHMAPGCIILVDDADRPSDSDVVERWSREFRIDVHLFGADRLRGVLEVR